MAVRAVGIQIAIANQQNNTSIPYGRKYGMGPSLFLTKHMLCKYHYRTCEDVGR